MLGETVIADVLAALLHAYEVPPLAVSVMLPPLQIAAVAGEIAAVGGGLTVTVLLAVAVQVLAAVTVTVYVVVDTGETVMAAVFAALLHRYVPPPLAVSVAGPPQVATVAGLIAAVGTGFTTTVVVAAVPAHPFTV
jgi:hypothetical protein